MLALMGTKSSWEALAMYHLAVCISEEKYHLIFYFAFCYYS